VPSAFVIFMSAIPWSHYDQRQHELVKQLARTHRVLFVEPPPLRPSWRIRVDELSPTLSRVVPPAPAPLGRFLPPANHINRRVTARALVRLLGVEPLRRLLWIDEDLAAPIIGRLGEDAVLYDATDLDWTFTRRWNRWHLRRGLAAAVASADLVLASSRALHQALPRGGQTPIELLNACDPDHFRPDGPRAAIVKSFPSPRLAYVGSVDDRAFDAPLVAEVARMRPQWSLLLAGPSTSSARRVLKGLPNVHLLETVPYAEVPSLLRGADVCLIPYRTGGRAAYVHPKKFYEYLATGKPVVSTPLPALEGSDAPHRRAATADGFVEAVEAALAESGDAELARRRRLVARANTWDERGDRLRDLLTRLEERAA
jgi:glycosyltransferase involved in cell wall biosynthesis